MPHQLCKKLYQVFHILLFSGPEPEKTGKQGILPIKKRKKMPHVSGSDNTERKMEK